MTAAAGIRLPVTAIRAIGLVLTLVYAGVVVWMYAKQPKTIAEVTGGLTATVALYRIDQASFDQGLAFFHKDQFAEARTALERADPAKQHGVTQFYIAYSYVRQGWGTAVCGRCAVQAGAGGAGTGRGGIAGRKGAGGQRPVARR